MAKEEHEDMSIAVEKELLHRYNDDKDEINSLIMSICLISRRNLDSVSRIGKRQHHNQGLTRRRRKDLNKEGQRVKKERAGELMRKSSEKDKSGMNRTSASSERLRKQTGGGGGGRKKSP